MKLNWIAILGLIASGGLGILVQALQNALPHEATLIANIAAIVIAIASIMLQILQPTAKIVADAAVVSPTTGEQVATNISSTSSLLKGP